jgi:hypothetical protein
MEYAKKNVRQSQSKVRKVKETGLWQEGIFLEPNVDKNYEQDDPGHGSGPSPFEHEETSVTQNQEATQRKKNDRIMCQKPDEYDARKEQHDGAPNARWAEIRQYRRSQAKEHKLK